MSTRTVEQEKKYQEHRLSLKTGECPFHDGDRVVLEAYKHWVLYTNDFPYKWTEEHWLLFPKRHTNKLNEQEENELVKIIKDFDDMHYVCLLNHESLKSIWCFHYHIIKPYTPNENN